MFNIRLGIVAIWFLLFIRTQVSGSTDPAYRDQTSPRTNTLFDDADDIQRQLDNEVRDRIRSGKPRFQWQDVTNVPAITFGQKTPKNIKPYLWGRVMTMFPDEDGNRVVEVSPKTVWVFHFPTRSPIYDPDDIVSKSSRGLWRTSSSKKEHPKSTFSYLYQDGIWNYMTQQTWSSMFPHCRGRAQSPVNLPFAYLRETRGARPLYFQHYNEKPESMVLHSDGQQVVLFGVWPKYRRPLLYGGAVHSRRYLFHSFTVRWPSEHRVAGQIYPVETQALFISAEYKDIDEALNSYPRDLQAILGISNLYKFGNHTHEGLAAIMNISRSVQDNEKQLTPKPLSFFTPPLSTYVCYEGSLTIPPCTETVIWVVRARALSVTRNFLDALEQTGTEGLPKKGYLRIPQPLNDRKVFIFK